MYKFNENIDCPNEKAVKSVKTSKTIFVVFLVLIVVSFGVFIPILYYGLDCTVIFRVENINYAGPETSFYVKLDNDYTGSHDLNITAENATTDPLFQIFISNMFFICMDEFTMNLITNKTETNNSSNRVIMTMLFAMMQSSMDFPLNTSIISENPYLDLINASHPFFFTTSVITKPMLFKIPYGFYALPVFIVEIVASYYPHGLHEKMIGYIPCIPDNFYSNPDVYKIQRGTWEYQMDDLKYNTEDSYKYFNQDYLGMNATGISGIGKMVFSLISPNLITDPIVGM